MPTTMPRKTTGYRIDLRVIETIETLASRAGTTPQRYIEDYFWRRGKEMLLIDAAAEPLGETRGGARPNTGNRKPKPTTEED